MWSNVFTNLEGYRGEFRLSFDMPFCLISRPQPEGIK